MNNYSVSTHDCLIFLQRCSTVPGLGTSMQHKATGKCIIITGGGAAQRARGQTVHSFRVKQRLKQVTVADLVGRTVGSKGVKKQTENNRVWVSFARGSTFFLFWLIIFIVHKKRSFTVKKTQQVPKKQCPLSNQSQCWHIKWENYCVQNWKHAFGLNCYDTQVTMRHD